MADFVVFSNGDFQITCFDVANWYLALPIHLQVLVIIGVFAFLALIITLVYYILKGVAYLIYYLLKGLYYLFKEIALGIYKLLKGAYHILFGKSAPVEQPQRPEQVIINEKTPEPAQTVITTVLAKVAFCSECGTKYTEKMSEQLKTKGIVYCVYCGHGFKSNKLYVES